MNLVLIGLRGSGKTTLGRLLAERLARPFIDLDDLTPRALGAATLAEAWATHGEDAFRKAEVKVLRETLRGRNQVMALGGGTPTSNEAAEMLKRAQNGRKVCVVYLRASTSTLRARLDGADNSGRPSLTGSDVLSEIPILFGRRDPIYRALSDAILHVDGRTIDELIEDIKQVCR